MNKNVSKSLKPYILLMPILAMLIGIFLYGLLSGILQSLGYVPQIGMTEFSFHYYEEVLSSKEFLESLIFSLRTSFLAAIISIVIGVLLSYTFVFNKKTNLFIESYQLPFMVPPTVAAILIIMLLGQSGYIPRILYHFGFITEMSEFPTMIYDELGIGVMFSYVWKGVAFITLVTHKPLKGIYQKYAKISGNLGASKWQTFWYVILPQLMPTLVTSFIINFAFAFGSFEVPYLLGASTPKALPVLSYIYYNNVDLTQRPYAMVINSIIIFVALVLLVVYLSATKLTKKYESK